MLHLLAWGMPGGPDWIIIAALGLLLFGKRLPEVGRSLGKGIIEFKKGLRGIEEGFESAARTPDKPAAYSDPHDYVMNSVPKFEPPTSAPIAQAGYEPQPYHD